MKPSPNRPEVIVLGSGLGGLVAGTLLSRNNRSVLLLREKGFQPTYSLKGYRFVPFSNFSEKRLRPSLLKRISQSLDLSLTQTQEEGNQAKKNFKRSTAASGFQVILPKARVDILPDRSLFEKEWRREFPKEVGQVKEFYQKLNQIQQLFQSVNGKSDSPSYFPLRQRSFVTSIFRLFDPFPKEKIDEKLRSFSREFREFIQLQLISWGNLYSDRFPMALAAHILSSETNGSNPGLDLERLEREILNQFLQRGGRVEEIERVKKVDCKWRKGLSLSLEGDPRAFGFQFLILNSPLHQISSVMGEKAQLLKWQKKIKPLYVIVPFFLGIPEKVIPVGMKDLLISISDLEKPYDNGNVLFLSLSAKGDETRAPEGKRALTVESLMDAEKWRETLLVDSQQEVMKHLRHLFPFFEKDVEFFDFKWASDHLPRWSYPHFLFKPGADFHWREEITPTKMTRNIYFVGKENFPSWGLAGEIFSGFMVAREILKKYS